MTLDRAAFAELYRTHYARVFGLCVQLLGSAERAEDAAQEAFLRAHRELGRYDRNRPFAGWILSIASHLCVDALRRRAKERRLFGTEPEERLAALGHEDDAAALDTLLAAERARDVNAAIAALPERYRLPLVLAYYRDASYDEIAAELDLTRGHVGALICRAKQTLRRALAARAEEPQR
jgi:RNA polymerase sigma-70 factor (ECF subfamily)